MIWVSIFCVSAKFKDNHENTEISIIEDGE